MAKQVTKVKRETPIAVKAKGAKAMDDDDMGTALVPMPKQTALSLDVGMEALRDLTAAVTDETQIDQLRSGVGERRGRAQVLLAMAFYKGATVDKSIDLGISLLDPKKHKAEKNKLGAQLRLVIGLAKSDGKKTTWTEEARAMQYAVPGDDEATIKRKKSVRSNFSTMVTKAARTALYAIENGVIPENESGHLRLTDGKKGTGDVKKHFGQSSVVLNEDENAKILDKKGQVTGTVKLKAKPSMTEIMRRVGEKHGVAVVARKDSRMQVVDPTKDMVARCGYMTQALEKLSGELPDELRKALEGLQNAISQALGE